VRVQMPHDLLVVGEQLVRIGHPTRMTHRYAPAGIRARESWETRRRPSHPTHPTHDCLAGRTGMPTEHRPRAGML
jgi:hypothetical protein